MSIELNKIFGQVMKTWRIGRDLSQAEAAKLLGISQAAYSNLEAGRVDTSLSTVAKAAETTGLPVAALLEIPTLPAPSVAEMMQALVDAGYRVEKAAPAAPRPKGEGSQS
jgi:transcriptional regulator with XRE-family HTH domain